MAFSLIFNIQIQEWYQSCHLCKQENKHIYPPKCSNALLFFFSGWQWYYKRYIDVKRGSVGGLGMLLAGYCVLSYIWSYPHISTCVDSSVFVYVAVRFGDNTTSQWLLFFFLFFPERDRWRKYH